MVDTTATLHLLDEYVRIPTISSQIDTTTIKQVQQFWRKLGLELEELWPAAPTGQPINNPVLYSEVRADRPAAPTLLLYGHWDVQPTGDPQQWRWRDQPCPPFQPTYFLDDRLAGQSPSEVASALTGPQLEQVTLVARGAADNKGQHLANILGVLAAKQAGQLAWNVKIFLDGEEEAGSPNLHAIVQAHRQKLKADFMVGSDGPKSDNRPTLLLGVRGLLGLVVRCSNKTGLLLHSGNYGNVKPNPVVPLARVLDRMEQQVRELGPLSEPFKREVARFFPADSPDRPRFEPYLDPTFNVNSLLSEGATTGQRRTIIPGWAEASIDVRLTPGLAPAEVYARLEAIVEAAAREQPGLEFTISQQSATAASYTSPEREGFAWLRQVVKDFWGDELRLIPLLGGTLPNDVFTDGLGLASYWLPAANSNNRQHDTNEHLVLEHYFRQQEFYARLAATPYQEGEQAL